nr:hypothetical protein [Mesorhizobium sp.]
MRVIEENIDVMAFAMTDLDHHGRAAAKRSFKVVTSGILPELVDQVGGDEKKPPPFGRTSAMKFSHYTASG